MDEAENIKPHVAAPSGSPMRGGTGREMTRDQLREQINTMEALEGVLSAIDDVSCVEFEPGEQAVIDLTFADRTPRKAPISFARGVPHEVALAGLRAMQQALENMLVKEAA